MARLRAMLLPALVGVTSACAAQPATSMSAPTASPAPVHSEPSTPPRAHAAADSRVEVVPDVTEPRPLAQAGCTFGPDEGTLVSAFQFEFDGRRFASIAGRVKVHTVQMSQNGDRAYAVVETDEVRLAADVAPRSVRVAVRSTRGAVDGWLEIRSAQVTRAVGGQATLAIRFPNRFEPVEQSETRIVPCSELTLLDDDRPSSWGNTQLVAGKVTPFVARLGGPVVGHLRGPEPASPRMQRGRSVAVDAIALPDLTKLEERGQFARVRLAGDSTAVVGWIAKSAIDEKAGMSNLLGVLRGGEGGDPVRLKCSRDVDLFVASGGNRVRVGVLRGHKPVHADQREQGGFNVYLRPADAVASLLASATAPPESELRMFVAAEDASACRMAGD